MEIFGCGFNGFGQLLPQTAQRCLLSPVKIFPDPSPEIECQTQQTDNEETDLFSASAKIRKYVSSWSTIYVLHDTKMCLQGFHAGEKTTNTNILSSVVDMDSCGKKLFYTKVDGACIVMDTRTGQALQVKGNEIAVPHFSNVAAGDMKAVAVTVDSSAGLISCESHSYVFRPFDCAVKFSQVSCGKEHVMLLSQIQQVYSFGLGSRGQLGHGTTDEESQPRLLEALGSVPMDTVSAGGWHSAAVSVIGDLYIWGWNESSQLGLPMQSKNASTPRNSLTETHGYQQSHGRTHIGAKRALQEEKDAGRDTAKKRKVSSFESTDPDISCASTKIEEEQHTVLKTSLICEKDHLQVDTRTDTSTPGNKEILDNSNLGDGDGCDEDGAGEEEIDESSDVVLFQALPSILDLPDRREVSKVSCGSRHTAAISVDGRLYTWGWGAYGQLGHGDAITRDTPIMVTCFTDQQVKVKDVSCGAWNTLVTISHLH